PCVSATTARLVAIGRATSNTRGSQSVATHGCTNGIAFGLFFLGLFGCGGFLGRFGFLSSCFGRSFFLGFGFLGCRLFCRGLFGGRLICCCLFSLGLFCCGFFLSGFLLGRFLFCCCLFSRRFFGSSLLGLCFFLSGLLFCQTTLLFFLFLFFLTRFFERDVGVYFGKRGLF